MELIKDTSIFPSVKSRDDSISQSRVNYVCTTYPLTQLTRPSPNDLSVQNGLLLKREAIIIPEMLRKNILEKIHEGHQGVNKCRNRAKDIVRRPGISRDIGNWVKYCAVCCKERPNVCEPMICAEISLRPWQKIAADLFCFEGKNYLLVVDYFSRYIELALLDRGTASKDVISHCKSIFARHGIRETLITDNGPQFSAAVFRKFLDAYGFTHVASSPRYPQSNGTYFKGTTPAGNRKLDPS